MATLIRARWVQQQNVHHLQSEGWMFVDDEDEILAMVGGADDQWAASVLGGGGRHSTFVTLAAAKRRVEKWFSATHTVGTSPTAWVLRSTP